VTAKGSRANALSEKIRALPRDVIADFAAATATWFFDLNPFDEFL
jgi:hypothetical protein